MIERSLGAWRDGDVIDATEDDDLLAEPPVPFAGNAMTLVVPPDNPAGIDDVTDHYAKIIAGLPAKPILIGHSFGGMIAQKLLGQDLAALDGLHLIG